MNDFETESYEVIEDKPNKKISIITIISIIIVIICIGAILTKLLVFNETKVIKTFINKSFETVNENLSIPDKISGKVSFDIDGKSLDENENKVVKALNELKINGRYEIDRNKKIQFNEIKAQYRNKNMFTAQTYFEKGYEYLYLGKAYKKIIRIKADNFESLFENNEKENKVVINELNKAIESSIKSKYISASFEKIDGTTYKKSTLKLTKENITKIKNDTCDKLLKDEEFLTNLNKMSGQSKENLKKIINEIKKEKVGNIKIDFSIYTTILGNKPYKIVLKQTKDSYIEIYINKNEYTYKINVKSNKIEGIIKVTKENNKDSYKFNIKNKNTEITFTINNEKDMTKEIKTRKIKSYIDYDKITEEDREQIYLNILGNDETMKFITDITGQEIG